MQRDGDNLVLSPSDLTGFLGCAHYTTLSLESPGAGSGSHGVREMSVAARRGLEHEQAYLEQLRADGLEVVDVGELPRTEQVAATEQVIRDGADVIFQAAFRDDSGSIDWQGFADFLVRTGETDDGAPLYEPEDTKLATSAKPSALIQLCDYAAHIERLQQQAPEHIHVVLGTGQKATFRTSELAAYYRRAKTRLELTVGDDSDDTYPWPVPACATCKYDERCSQKRIDDDHLTLVANLGREQARKLEAAGVSTLAQLAGTDTSLTVRGIGTDFLRRLQRQARVQLRTRGTGDGSPAWELIEPEQGTGRGLESLPEPCEGDLFFDMEGDPFVGDRGLEYLFGVGWLEKGEFEFKAFWAHDAAAEKRAFEEFVDFVIERRRQFPDMHVFHYAPYEPSTLGRLMGFHATREDEVDDLLRSRVLVDLYQVVRQAVVVGSPSYSIKKLEPLYMAAREAEITDAGSSIDEYERWLEERDQQILDDIEEYNRDDCLSTQLLRDWLEERRPDAEREFGISLGRRGVAGPDLDADGDAESAIDPDVEEIRANTAELAAQLTDGTDDRPDRSDSESHARWLLAQLLDWHRREAKPEWWRFFDRVQNMTLADLAEDTESISGLTYEGVVDSVRRSDIHRYRFDADQEHKLSPGTQVSDPATKLLEHQTGEKTPGPGKLVAVDSVKGTLDLERGKQSDAPHPEALIPAGPIPDGVLREAITRVATGVVANGFSTTGSDAAIADMLLRRPPRVGGVTEGSPLYEDRHQLDTVDVATDLALRLQHSYLPIQGPPGTGKTYTAARMILALVKAGKRVGITALSHAVISNLVDELCDADSNHQVRVLQLNKDEISDRAQLERASNPGEVVAALDAGEADVVAGTAWLFSREDMVGKLDYLIIDEAGQLSQANVVAVSGAADNSIPVGDPQQLAQPLKGTHPPGAEMSCLEYILDGRETVPSDRGLFLPDTYRMHPKLTQFVSHLSYGGRLEAMPFTDRQQVADGPLVSGSGIRWVEVLHDGNRTSSSEEAEQIRELYEALIGRDWTNQKGEVAPITNRDILVVAPYNAQVRMLSNTLPDGARVGTVDKFQGQEAAVVLISMSASSAADIPRGLEFLYDRRRLNVAVSRTRAMSVVVANPDLLSADCRTVNQLKLVNGLCLLAEAGS